MDRLAPETLILDYVLISKRAQNRRGRVVVQKHLRNTLLFNLRQLYG